MKLYNRWIFAFLLIFLHQNLSAINYKIQDLGTLDTNHSHVSDLNNQNCVTGFFAINGNSSTAFIWEPNKGLIPLPNVPYTGPLINNHNQLVNIVWFTTNFWFKENYTTKHLYLYNSDGTNQDIGVPEKWNIEKLKYWQSPNEYDYRELGIISFTDDGQILVSNALQVEKATKFAIWQNGKFQELDTKEISRFYDMNNHGLILGRKMIEKDGEKIPMLVIYDRKEGTFTEIMKDINTITRKLNDRGQVLISQVAFAGSAGRGFLWDSEKGLIELEDFLPTAFNNSDQIIGFKISSLLVNKYEPLLWTPNEVFSLNTILEIDSFDSLWNEITVLRGINDNGYIIGTGNYQGATQSFVLIPQ